MHSSGPLGLLCLLATAGRSGSNNEGPEQRERLSFGDRCGRLGYAHMVPRGEGQLDRNEACYCKRRLRKYEGDNQFAVAINARPVTADDGGTRG
jgi:hypothetical protein